jgi:hypothetical protein
MLLAFMLTMPGRNTWNGRWSGDGEVFCIVRNLGQSKAARVKGGRLIGDHGYAWDDGWRARVRVFEVDSAMARRLRAKSKGFWGYGWMVDSLLKHGDIRTGE